MRKMKIQDITFPTKKPIKKISTERFYTKSITLSGRFVQIKNVPRGLISEADR